jgi:dephospho-CoA kinase
MILVGLTGGVATGKSTVAKMFERCGAHIIDADVLAHRAVEPDRPAWRAIVKAFGKQILNADRTLNRAALGRIVFRNRAKLRRLERIIHPHVAEMQEQLAKAIQRRHPRAVILYEVPLLFEAGVDRRVDRIVVVTADRETQVARLKTRNGFTRAEALRRSRSQMPIGRKAAAADYLLDGTIPRSRLLTQVRRLYRELRELA